MSGRQGTMRSFLSHKLLPALGKLVLGTGVTGLGLALAKLIDSKNWSWAVTLTGVGFYLMTIAVNPLLGFLLWVVTAPFSRFYYLDIQMGRGIPDLTLTRLCAAFITVFLAAQIAVGRRKVPHIGKVEVAMLLFGAAFAISLPRAASGPKAALTLYADGYFIPFLIYLFARMLITDRRGLRAAMISLFVVGAYLSFIDIREQVTGQILFWFRDASWYYQGGVRKLSGLLGSPAFFGTSLAMIAPFTIRSVLRTENPSKRFFGFALFAAEVLGVIFTYNRGSWLGFVVGMLIMLVFYSRFRRAARPILLMLIIIAAASWGVIYSSPVFQERIQAEKPVEYRMEVYQMTPRIIGGSYLLGLGLGNYESAYLKAVHGIYGARPWAAPPMPHNSILYQFFMGGLAAAVPFTLVFVFIAWDTYILWRRSSRGGVWIDQGLSACMLSAFVAYMIQSMVVDFMAAYFVNMLFFFIVGAVYGVRDSLPSPEERSQLGESVEVVAT